MSNGDRELLDVLRSEYERAPEIYQATRYWRHYEEKILGEIERLDMNEIESGKYPYLATFGFGGAPYPRPPGRLSFRPKNLLKRFIRGVAARMSRAGEDWFLPHNLRTGDIYALAFNRCQLFALEAGARSPKNLQASAFGNPQDLFLVDGKPYTIRFLDYFCRYCFAAGLIDFRGNEVFVEIGSGSGKQIEVLKKAFPAATFVCFDLPLQAYLAYRYLTAVFGDDVAPLSDTCLWKDMSKLEAGKIYILGNWQTPLLEQIEFDVFWNAASFGEMEPEVVQNYLRFVRPKAKWIYLMQARWGKEKGLKRGGVAEPQTFGSYCSYLPEYDLAEQRDCQTSLFPLRDSGAYFEAVWRRKTEP